jgi:HEAT repeat protein
VLIDALGSNDWRIRRGIAYTLGLQPTKCFRMRVTDDKIIDMAMKALRDERVEVRVEAAKTLGKIGDQRAMEALANILADDVPEVRAEAAKALREIVTGSCRQTPSGSSGWICEKLLEKMRDEKILKSLLDAANDKNVDVRGAAIWTLALLGEDERVTPLIIQAIRDDDRYIRLRAVDSIYFILCNYALDVLVPAL